jgi:F-type H+-transporting ATPase subunit gamma
MTANRGLCGGFNANIVRRARREIERIRSEGKEVRLICVGRKGLDVLKREYSDIIIKSFLDFGGKEGPDYSAVEEINLFIIALFEEGGFDVCTLLYNRFKNVLTQMPTMKQLIPLELPDHEEEEEEQTEAPQIYKFEPGKDKLLEMLLPKNVATQIYHAMLDNAAGEQAARMTAMDNATSSAGDMIDRLTIKYNRERQAVITTELIEIVSGAEAL